MSVKTRLIMLSLMASAGLLLLGSVALYQMSQFNDGMAQIFERSEVGQHAVIAVDRAENAFKTQVQEWKNILLRGNDPGLFKQHMEGFRKEEAHVEQELRKLTSYLAGETNIDVDLGALLSEHRKLGERYREALKNFDPDDPSAGKAVDQAVRGMDRAFSEGLVDIAHKILAEEDRLHESAKVRMVTSYQTVRVVLLVAMVGLIAGIAVLAALMIRRISSALSALESTMTQASSQHDLRLRAAATGGDEIAAAGGSFNTMLESFQRLVGDISQQASGVASNAVAVSGAVSEISGGVSTLNDSTVTVAASIEELTVSINHVRDNAEQTLEISRESASLASTGGEVVGRTVSRMLSTVDHVQASAERIEALGQQTADISGIVATIREVADQTNLLALNAAIEAARAGEQGRGFAVVADEVRKLAERTAHATHDIAEKIAAIQGQAQQAVSGMHDMVEQVRENAEQAREAGEVIVRIEEGAHKVVDVAGEITSALREQSVASDTIARQLETIARSSDESTAALAQASDSVRALEGMAARMREAAARFKV